MKIIQCDPIWATVDASIWHTAFAKKLRDSLMHDVAGIVIELLTHFTLITGLTGKASHPAIPVILRRGRNMAPHSHPEHLILYYPVGHPAKLRTELGDYTPVKNTAVYLPPNCRHSVDAVTTKKVRLSLALRWNPTT